MTAIARRPDPLSQLFEFTWKGVPFPTTSFRMVLRHDLAQHKFVKRDGANIESTGRAPFEFSADIPWFNDISPGPRESWVQGALYPEGWRRFMAVAQDGATGELQHPELGLVTCKLEHCETDWATSVRGGPTSKATWLETIDAPNALADLFAQASPISAAIQAGADIDRNLSAITPSLPKTPTFEPTFEDSIRTIQGVFDQKTLMTRKVTGAIDNVAYRLTSLEAAINTSSAAPGAAIQHVKQWPVRDAIERMKSAMNDIRTTLFAGQRPIGIYIPDRSATLGAMSVDIKASITDLMRLNPALIQSPVVPAQSRVRYFLS